MMRAKRPQSGKYTIVAKNQVGEDKADVDITVLGKPSSPNGPLKVSDVHKHGCKLKWEKPDDDGGAPIDYYQIEKLDPLTGMFKTQFNSILCIKNIEFHLNNFAESRSINSLTN